MTRGASGGDRTAQATASLINIEKELEGVGPVDNRPSTD